MSCPDSNNDYINYGSVRNHAGHEYSVRQAYEDGMFFHFFK